MRYRLTSLAHARLRALPYVRIAMRDCGQMPSVQERGRQLRGLHRSRRWYGCGMRESRREERTYPWHDGMREGRMRETSRWAKRIPRNYTMYLRRCKVSNRIGRGNRDKQYLYLSLFYWGKDRRGELRRAQYTRKNTKTMEKKVKCTLGE